MQQAAAHYGIIGYPLEVTFSPDYFNEKFSREGISARYDMYPMESAAAFPVLLAGDPLFRGFNVTMPHKSAVMPFLDALAEDAAAIGAVNCISVQDGKTKGWNTDWIGFRDSLQTCLRPFHKKALILGTGGASKAVAYALQQLGIEFRYVSRTPDTAQLSYSALNEAVLNEHLLLVNTTPLGMQGHSHTAPDIPYELLGEKHLLYDLVYTPEVTPFLAKGRRQGAATRNGSDMFRLQAEASWRIWNI